MKNRALALFALFCLSPHIASAETENRSRLSTEDPFFALKAALDRYDLEAFEKELEKFDPATQNALLQNFVPQKLGAALNAADQGSLQSDKQQQQYKNSFAFFSSLIDRYATTLKATLANMLSVAPRRDNVALTQFLIDKGVPANPADNAPLFAAVEAGNIPAIDLLLSKGADINGPREFGAERVYPIAAAIDSPTPLETTKHLLKKGAKLNVPITTWDTQFSLLDAAIIGKDEALPLYLMKKGLKLHERVGSFLLVHEAAKRGMSRVLQAFIKNHIPITAKDEMGNTALHVLCTSLLPINSKRFEKMVTMLVNNGIDINDQNNSGKTAIDLAREKREEADDKTAWDTVIKKMEKMASSSKNE